jgi:5,10-methylene-tetrahydrofolate dehydrogenase/methenyl tetrahydrofolate cyclohydrolase
MKKKAAEEVGINFNLKEMPATSTAQEILNAVHTFNDDPDIHGILVQLPLPPTINEKEVLSAVSFEKDVDGFHPRNIGMLAMKGYDPLFVPCTPKGCIELLDRSGVQIEGKNAVVIGRSNIVGIPMALLLVHRNATVTVCHSRTEDLPAKVKQADIVVAAVGKPELVRGSWVKDGAVVIDVGVNSVPAIDPAPAPAPATATAAATAPAQPRSRLVGDVCFSEVSQVASKITKVPGGVGPMTVAMLLKNTLDSAKRHQGVLW